MYLNSQVLNKFSRRKKNSTSRTCFLKARKERKRKLEGMRKYLFSQISSSWPFPLATLSLCPHQTLDSESQDKQSIVSITLNDTIIIIILDLTSEQKVHASLTLLSTVAMVLLPKVELMLWFRGWNIIETNGCDQSGINCRPLSC